MANMPETIRIDLGVEKISEVAYVRQDIADARSAVLSSKLGQLTILLLQEAYVDARELALQIKVEFPDGSPVATLEEVS